MKNPFVLAFAASIAIAADSSHAANETYIFDPNHSFARFEYDHFGFSHQMSRFDTMTGKIVIDRATKTGIVEASIDPKSVSTGSAVFNGHLQGEDFLDSARYHAISFKSTKFKFSGDKIDSVEGDLTLKGITRPVNLQVSSFHCGPHPVLQKEACGANVTTIIKRTDFNLGKYAPYVQDDVTLKFSIDAGKE